MEYGRTRGLDVLNKLRIDAAMFEKADKVYGKEDSFTVES